MSDLRSLTKDELEEELTACEKKRRAFEAVYNVWCAEYHAVCDKHEALLDEQLRRAKLAQEANRWAFEQAFK